MAAECLFVRFSAIRVVLCSRLALACPMDVYSCYVVVWLIFWEARECFCLDLLG